MTGLTLVDKGPVIAEQRNRLWSSTDEFYQSSATDIPTPTNHISLGDIQSGVQAILEESLPPLVPAGYRSPSPASSRSSLPRPAAFARTAPRGNALIRKATSIIEAVEAEARVTAATLNFNGDHRPSDDILRNLLDTATAAVDSGGKSLALVKNQAQVVVDLKRKVLEDLRLIDSRISQLGALLPPTFTERQPLVVETGKNHFLLLFQCLNYHFKRPYIRKSSC